MRYVFFLCALLLPVQAWSATPDQLRDEAAQLMQKSRGNGGELAADLMLARAKVEAALSVLEAKPKLSEADENLQTELTSMKYWIRKMTILEDVAPESKRAVVATNGPSNPPAGGGSNTATAGAKKSDELDPELTKAIAAARANPPKAPQKLTGTSNKYKDIPLYLEKVADDIKDRYDQSKTGKVGYVRECQHEFFKRDILSVMALFRSKSEALQAASLLFEAVDRFNIGVNGENLIVIRLQACMQLDHLVNAPPKGLPDADRQALIKAYLNLARGPYDFEPNRKEFEEGMAKSKNPLYKKGFALAQFGCLYTCGQVLVAHSSYVKLSQDVIAPFNPQISRMFIDNLNKYRNWTQPKLKEEVKKLNTFLSDLVKEDPSSELLANYVDYEWSSYYPEDRNNGEAARKAVRIFQSCQSRELADDEQAILRLMVDNYMKHNKLVDETVHQ